MSRHGLHLLNHPTIWLADRLDYPSDDDLTHLTTLGYPSEYGIDRLDYPFDDWLTHLTTLVILGCYALPYLTTLLMAG
jgi:hypothetical protein